MTSFAVALGRVAASALAATLAGTLAAAGLLPRGASRGERLGWAFAGGVLLVAGSVPLALRLGLRPGWLVFATIAVLAAGAGLRFRVADSVAPRPLRAAARGNGVAAAAMIVLAAAGVAVYALRALTEPMWSNDFLAIWGLKGKTLYLAGGLPERLYRSPDYLFSHPEYPLGLPLLYAGIAFLSGSWEDHALALLFPCFQIATVAALAGWLRRRGATRALALGASAVVALFAPLYSSFLTGLAEVPLAFAALLFGGALADALDGVDSGAARRLAVSAALLAALKNEGSFLAAAGALVALLSPGAARKRLALVALIPAAAVRLAHLPWRSRLPLADFDFGAVSLARVLDAIGAALRTPGAAGWAGLASALVLVLAGRRTPAGDRILAIVGMALAAYVLIPAAAARGPEWLVNTTLRRTASALAPLAAAGIALRVKGSFEPETEGAGAA